MMILQNYLNQLLKSLEQVVNKDCSLGEFSKDLDLMDYQIQLLAEEGWLKAPESANKISSAAIEELKDGAEDKLKNICLSTIEMRDLLECSAEVLSDMITSSLLKSIGKKKRRGQMRSLFRLSDCLEKESEIVEHLKRNQDKLDEKQMTRMAKHSQHEEQLIGKTKYTAERLHFEENLDAHAGHVVEVKKADFVLDKWQLEAVHALEEEKNVFVQAPTGTGKTAVVEEFLRRKIDKGVFLFYAVPIKALANDKFFDFCKMFGRDRVGINTGDITLNPDAPVVVGTTEIVRNILFNRPDAYDVIAFDEAQYLADEERGGAWEESIIMCDPKTTMIFMSGSVGNAEEILDWIKGIKKKEVSLFVEEHRPVPLKFAFPFGDGFIEKKEWNSLQSLSVKTQRTFYGKPREFLDAVDEAHMTPLLMFMARRRDCEEVFAEVSDVDEEVGENLRKQLEDHPEGRYLNARLKTMIVKKGCAYHHAGLLPAEKRVVETLAKKGELRYVSATMSLASGVNFSVRTCMISEYQRPGRNGIMQKLSPSEVLQMWGRAGRRGLDTEGYVIPCMDILGTEGFHGAKAYPEKIHRRSFASATNILSILKRHSTDVLENLYRQSFSRYLDGTEYYVFSDSTMKREAGSICGSPTYELPPYRQGVYKNLQKNRLEEKFRCASCENLKKCERVYEKNIKHNPLQMMVKHLKMNAFLNADMTLTHKGHLAETFHSEIGLMVAHHIVEGRVRPDNIIKYAASISAPGHIGFLGRFQRVQLESARRILNPRFFPNMWERNRGREFFITWNPPAGQVAQEWLEAKSWEEFSGQNRFDKIQGDIFRTLLRAGELLRSMTFLDDLKPELAEAARVAVKLLMRPPLIPEGIFKNSDE